MKKLNNLYIAANPIYSRSDKWKQQLREIMPTLKELEGCPLDRPTYMFSNPAGVAGIVKKGMNPKA